MQWGLGLLIAGGAVAASGAVAADERAFRCVIEPALTVKVGSPVVGLLRRVPISRGDIVEKGQLIAELDSAVEEATLALNRVRAENSAPIAAAQARLELNLKQLERAEKLAEKKVVAAETVDERRATLEVSRQNLRQAEVEREVLKKEVERSQALVAQRRIESPIDGVVTERHLTAGEFVHQEAYIMDIAQLDPLHVEVFLPIELYGRVRRGITGEVMPEAPIGGRYAAKVTIVDRVLDAASGTFGVRLELPNADHALPAGIRCKVIFPGIDTPESARRS